MWPPSLSADTSGDVVSVATIESDLVGVVAASALSASGSVGDS